MNPVLSLQLIPQKLELQEKYLIDNPGVGIVTTLHTDYNTNMNGRSDITTAYSKVDTFEKIKKVLENENCIVGASALISKSVFVDLDGFDLSQVPGQVWVNYNKPMWEDWDFWLRAIHEGHKIHVLSDRLYQWHHDLSVPRYFSTEKYREQIAEK